MAKNNVKRHSDLGRVKKIDPYLNEIRQNYEDWNSEQRNKKIKEMIQYLTVKYPTYMRDLMADKFTYKGMTFGFGDRVYMFRTKFIIVEIRPEDKSVRIMSEYEFFKFFDCTKIKNGKGTWYKIPDYPLFGNLIDIKNPLLIK